MDRRTALRTLATAGALPLFAPERVAAVLEARRYLASDEDATGSGQALSEHELVMVGLIADVILPRTETPSASDLGVHEFVDLIAAEWMDGDESDALHDGLATLDETSRARFGRGFVDSSGREQLRLITELDTSMPESVSSDGVGDGFYPMLKRLVLVGYFTTEEGASQVGYRTIPGEFGGCVAPGVGR